MNVAHFSIRNEIIVNGFEGKIQFRNVYFIILIPVHIVIHPPIVGQLLLVNDTVFCEVVERINPLELLECTLEGLDIVTLGAETHTGREGGRGVEVEWGRGVLLKYNNLPLPLPQGSV